MVMSNGVDMRTCSKEAERAVSEARRKYARVLACWASDALSLRRRGLDRPVYSGRAAQNLRTVAADRLG
jgi:hypothetical protein